PNSEFNHGETRNLGARLARGEFVAYLTQDATPASDRWLHYLVEAFNIEPQVAAVYGPHLPRPDCDPITRRDLEQFFAAMGPADQPTVQRIEEARDGEEAQRLEGPLGFYSDVNSCLRKSVWEKLPYRRLDYAEDQAFGRDILKAGYWKVYEPRAGVIHSHSYPLPHYFRRQFDEYRGLRRSIGYVQTNGILRILAGSARAGMQDARYILKRRYPPAAALKWCLYAFPMNFSRRLAGYLAAREERLPKSLLKRISLEQQARDKVG
ncbi:MAG TPA: glycosyltransferase family 2 protein, partial [Dehalococcoidia bacterium]|nr:glycosyltransferase family 2 protein [Dehalococcoidia bacterium]